MNKDSNLAAAVRTTCRNLICDYLTFHNTAYAVCYPHGCDRRGPRVMRNAAYMIYPALSLPTYSQPGEGAAPGQTLLAPQCNVETDVDAAAPCIAEPWQARPVVWIQSGVRSTAPRRRQTKEIVETTSHYTTTS